MIQKFRRRSTDKSTNNITARQTDRQAGRPADRQTDEQTDRQTWLHGHDRARPELYTVPEIGHVLATWKVVSTITNVAHFWHESKDNVSTGK